VQSEEINELAGALSKAQGEFTAIPKGEPTRFSSPSTQDFLM